MPIHLPPISRRSFVGAALAALAGSRSSFAQEQADGERWILLADAHIASDPKTKRGDVAMADNFKRVAAEFLKEAAKSSGVILHGDAAFLKGLREDYGTLASLLEPISSAGLPIHIMLGNHDDRTIFLSGFADRVPKARPLSSHHVAILEGKRANLILLDTLEGTNSTPGILGDEQLQWLSAVLDVRKDKPAVVCMHHNPEFAKVKKISGLKDTDALMAVLTPRTQVKALVFGHTHHWAHAEHDGIHCVNLPPTAYVFQERDPNGWVELTLTDTGGRFKLHALDPAHKANGQVLDLKWRA